jgi:ammonia channel protein AmtB
LDPICQNDENFNKELNLQHTNFIINVYRLDEPTDAVAIHLIPGFWGAIAVPLFSFTGQLLSTHQNRLNHAEFMRISNPLKNFEKNASEKLFASNLFQTYIVVDKPYFSTFFSLFSQLIRMHKDTNSEIKIF